MLTSKMLLDPRYTSKLILGHLSRRPGIYGDVCEVWSNDVKRQLVASSAGIKL